LENVKQEHQQTIDALSESKEQKSVNLNANRSILEHKLQCEQFDKTLAEKEQSLFQTVIYLVLFLII
jgi:hypothetical protein